jgi:hypothetical protein
LPEGFFPAFWLSTCALFPFLIVGVQAGVKSFSQQIFLQKQTQQIGGPGTLKNH